jgi:hypothetical protein
MLRDFTGGVAGAPGVPFTERSAGRWDNLPVTEQ